jgi:hypothetical protein
MEDGHVMSVAFRPFPKDAGLLSVYDGSQIKAETAFAHYTTSLGFASVGVWSVSVGECDELRLPARPEPRDYSPAHAVIDFTGLERRQVEARSKLLASKAEIRGCQFRKTG